MRAQQREHRGNDDCIEHDAERGDGSEARQRGAMWPAARERVAMVEHIVDDRAGDRPRRRSDHDTDARELHERDQHRVVNSGAERACARIAEELGRDGRRYWSGLGRGHGMARAACARRGAMTKRNSTAPPPVCPQRLYRGLRKWLTTISVTLLPSPAQRERGSGVRAELC